MLSRGFAFVGWAAAIGLLLALLMARLVDGGPTPLAFMALLVQTFAFHAGLAVAMLLLIALVLRRWKLGVALLLGVLVTIGPLGLRVMRSDATAVDDDGTLTLLSCNLCYGRADPDRLIAWIDEIDPDVIVLQEYGGEWPEVVDAHLRERYPHVWEEPRPDAFGQATLSRSALVGVTRTVWPGYWDIPSARMTIEHEQRRVDVTNVHVYPPVGLSWFAQQGHQLARLSVDAEKRLGEFDYSSGHRDVQGAVLIGDFNAPWGTGHMQPLKDKSLAFDTRFLWEAHEEIGRGRGTTWGPRRGVLSLAPGIRLDHAVYGGELEPVFSVVGPDVGSDHRPIAAGFRWRSPD